MRYEIVQDLVIVSGGAFLLLAGVVSKDPVNIILSGVFTLFGIMVLAADIRRNV